MGLFLFKSHPRKAHKASILAFVFALSSLVALLSPTATFAAQKVSTMDPANAATAFVYYKALRTCMTDGQLKNYMGGYNVDPRSMSADNAVTFEWFFSNIGVVTGSGLNSTDVGVYGDTRATGDGQYKCYTDDQGKAFIQKLLSITGYTSGPEFLCAIGFTRQVSGSSCATIVNGANNDFVAPSDIGKNLDIWWKSLTGSSNLGPGGIGAGEYVLYYESFSKACGVTASPTGSYTVIAPSTDSKTLVEKKFAIADRDKSTSTSVRVYSGTTKTCGELAGLLSASSGAVSKFRSYPKAPGDSTAADSTTESAATCRVDGIGWILCPVANALAGITDALFAAVSAFMKVQPLSFSTDDTLYTAWSVMRSIANIAFVIVFLIIIFSQLTSAGVSNYGVKKLLPRLIVGAILVNVSYFICAIAVDASNVLGFGIQALFEEITKQTANIGEIGSNWVGMTALVLGGSGVVAGVTIAATAITSMSVWAMLAALLPLLVGALFALVIAFLVLLARQALIIMLIIISPLAFVAYLLPNTEDLFKKWRKLFTSLLVLFPLLSVVFGASLLASVILRESSRSALETGTGDVFIAFCMYVGSFAVQAIPFFITPLLINLSQGVLGRFAGLVNNKNKGPFDRLRKGAERIGKDAQNRGYATKLSDRRKGSIFSAGARRRARVERVTGSLDNLAKHNAGDYIAGELGKDDSGLAKRMAGGDEAKGKIIAAQAVAAGEGEELKEAMQPLIRALAAMDPSSKMGHLRSEIATGGSRASAALHYAAQIGDTGFLREQLTAGAGQPSGDLTRKTREAIQANVGSVMGKAPDLVKGAESAFGSVKGNDLVQFKPDTAEAYLDHIKMLSTKTDPAGIKAYQTAVNGFNSSIQDVSMSTELQGQFDGKVGTKIQTLLADPSYAAIAPAMPAISYIHPDGKIRP